MNNIYHDLEAIKSVAVAHTKDDGYNYNIILHNPNAKGEFDLEAGSTYEFVMDSYFNTPRPNVILICKTKDLLRVEDAQRLIDSFSPDAPHMKMRQEFQRIDAEMQYAKNSEEGAGSKLKEGLSVVHAEPDGVTYKQGKAGLERVSHTNRNDLCPACKKEGIKIKFKKCNKHNG